MRLSVPNIPPSILAKAALRNGPSVLPSEAVQRIASFLASGTAALLTGAGVSVDSGVKAYRGKDGRYMNPDYKCAIASNRDFCTHVADAPIQTDFLSGAHRRQPSRTIVSSTILASLIHRIFTRPSHLAKPNSFRPRCIAACWHSRSYYNTERRWAPPLRAAPRSIGSRSRHAHP